VSRSCVIVGAGLGGLATAIRLQSSGWRVTILEKNAEVGGRCSILRAGDYTFDMGPTLLLMRDVLDDLFRSAGRRLEDYLELVRVHPNYRVHFGDGSSIEFSSDYGRMREQLDSLEPGAGRAFDRYLADAGYKYHVSRERFVERNFLHWNHFATPTNLYYLFATNTLRKLSRHAARYFRDPRLIDAFTFQTMYLGLAPSHAPSVYSLLPYTELEEGIWFPRGGMYRLPQALERLARELGVEIRLNQSVQRIEIDGAEARGVVLESGEVVRSDAVVANADLPYVYESLLPARAQSHAHRWRMDHLNFGSSAFLLYLGLDREYPHLNHHDVFLSADTRENFDAIFRRFELPRNPSFYLCTPSRTDRTLAPAGGEALYVLVPVPRLSREIDWNKERAGFRDVILGRLEESGLPDIRRHIRYERVYTPQDFVTDYNVARGSAFGISHTFSQVGYMRPSNKAPGIANLFFVGASTQPGGGIPMVIIGSRLTAERMEQGVPHVA